MTGDSMEKATFAAGCFWHVEAAFRKVKGVVGTRVGYTGGSFENPSYEDVCTGRTGHAESVELDFDPSQISYSALLDIFWSIHDPTTPDRQGPDVGSQYRSVVFYHSPEQREEAAASAQRLEKSGRLGRRRIVTQIVPAGKFYAAEEYHQRYIEKRGQVSCRLC
jgi:peptide-methionine (S)-S-oxide reductase